jgi:hypothetical protein
MKTIEAPADLVCSKCGSSYFEYSHSRSMFDHETKRQIKVAQFICQWCLVYEPTRHLKSWDNPESVDTSKDFELDSGRFKGQRISDVFDDPKGVRYLHKIAEKDPRVRSWLELTKSS